MPLRLSLKETVFRYLISQGRDLQGLTSDLQQEIIFSTFQKKFSDIYQYLVVNKQLSASEWLACYQYLFVLNSPVQSLPPQLEDACKHILKDYGENTHWQQLWQRHRWCVCLALILLEKIDVDAVQNTDTFKYDPLDYATQLTCTGLVQRLLETNVVKTINTPSLGGNIPLRSAVLYGGDAIARLLIAKQADITVKGIEGNTVLIEAASRGKLELVRFFLKSGADPYIAGSFGSTALHVAAERGFLPIIRLLLAEGMKIDFSAGRGTALHFAAKANNMSAVQELVAQGADPTLKNINGTPEETPQELAYDPRIKKFLAQAEIDFKQREAEATTALINRYKLSSTTPKDLAKGLRNAAVNGKHEDMRRFMSLAAPLNLQDDNPANRRTALHWAVIKKHLNCIETLLNEGAMIGIPDSYSKTALDYAKESGSSQVLNLFAHDWFKRKTYSLYNYLKNNNETEWHFRQNEVWQKIIDIRENKDTKNWIDDALAETLVKCRNMPEKDILNIIIGRIQDKNFATIYTCIVSKKINLKGLHLVRYDLSMLSLAAHNGDPSIVRALLLAGTTDLDTQQSGAMSYAISNNCFEAVQVLFELGVFKTPLGIPPLQYVASLGKIEIAKFLIAQGVNKDELYAGGRPLASAISTRNNLEMVRLLCESGANVNIVNRRAFNRTFLHLASELGHLEYVKCLVENGADVMREDSNKQKPSDRAKTPEIKAYLLGKEAEAALQPASKDSKQNEVFIDDEESEATNYHGFLNVYPEVLFPPNALNLDPKLSPQSLANLWVELGNEGRSILEKSVKQRRELVKKSFLKAEIYKEITEMLNQQKLLAQKPALKEQNIASSNASQLRSYLSSTERLSLSGNSQASSVLKPEGEGAPRFKM